MGKGPLRSLAHTCGGSPLAIPTPPGVATCRGRTLMASGREAAPPGLDRGCDAARWLLAMPNQVSLLSFPLQSLSLWLRIFMLLLYCSQWLLLCIKKLFIIPLLQFNPADNCFLLEHYQFGAYVSKHRSLYSVYTHAETRTHTSPLLTHSHQNRSFAQGGLCRHSCTDHHRNSVWLLTLRWGYQDGYLWHLALSSWVAKFVSWLKYFIWNQNFHAFSSSQEKKNLFYLHQLLFTKVTQNFSWRARKIFFFIFKKIWGKHISWLASQSVLTYRWNKSLQDEQQYLVAIWPTQVAWGGGPGLFKGLQRPLWSPACLNCDWNLCQFGFIPNSSGPGRLWLFQ